MGKKYLPTQKRKKQIGILNVQIIECNLVKLKLVLQIEELHKLHLIQYKWPYKNNLSNLMNHTILPHRATFICFPKLVEPNE